MSLIKVTLAAAGSLALFGSALAEQRSAESDAVPTLERADLEAWLDGYLPFALQRSQIAGAAITVVRNGEVLLQKGYGYADVAAKKRVDPDKTVFRGESISKVFSATAVMQLVEQGKLDLDADVNRYLDFKIPDAFGQPITLRNLLTHSAGFADVAKNESHIAVDSFPPLAEHLRRRLPPRVFPPGETPAYSNYGASLGGYIVQRVSGELFEDYIQKHILDALGMRHSTCYQPTPAALQADMRKAYDVASGSEMPFELIAERPAGCLSATATDMARFVIAHLQGGQYDGRQILAPQTARLMHARASRVAPHVNGMALGFIQNDRNGRRIIGHDGDGFGSHSDMQLYLDHGVGYFLAFNSDGVDTAAYAVRSSFFEDFTDRYFPAPRPQETTVATAIEHARMADGSYEASRRLRGILSIFMLFNQVRVEARDDGTIAIATPPSGKLQTFHETGPFLWRAIDGSELVEMQLQDGKVAAFHQNPTVAFLRMPFWRSGAFVLPLLGGGTVVLLLTVVVWPIGALARRHYGRTLALTAREARSRQLARLGALVNVLFLAGWIFLTLNVVSHLYLFNDALDPWLRLLQLIGLLGVLGAAAALWDGWLVVRSGRGWPTKTWSVVLAVASLTIVWIYFAFHLIGINLDY